MNAEGRIAMLVTLMSTAEALAPEAAAVFVACGVRWGLTAEEAEEHVQRASTGIAMRHCLRITRASRDEGIVIFRHIAAVLVADGAEASPSTRALARELGRVLTLDAAAADAIVDDAAAGARERRDA